VVVSGFVGRYIYAAVPRTADGAVLEAQELNDTLAALRLEEAARPEVMDAGTIRMRRDIEKRIRTLERQISALRWERRALATWHTIHIPLGMTMFVVAFAHIAGALYYGTLMR
jgi:hypothetical protein